MTTKEMIAVMQAYDKGKQIQWFNKKRPESKWNDVVVAPVWNFATYDYRVKPEEQKLKLRPYANAEEFFKAQIKHGGCIHWNDSTDTHYFPVSVTNKEVRVLSFSGKIQTYLLYALVENCCWLDGTPCGITEKK